MLDSARVPTSSDSMKRHMTITCLSMGGRHASLRSMLAKVLWLQRSSGASSVCESSVSFFQLEDTNILSCLSEQSRQWREETSF